MAATAGSMIKSGAPASKRSKPKMVSKVYANACLEKSPNYSDYENCGVKWGCQDDYEVVCKIGRGKYSEVFEGFDVKEQSPCVVKVNAFVWN